MVKNIGKSFLQDRNYRHPELSGIGLQSFSGVINTFKSFRTMKVCLECGDKLLGRADKKYCNDHCRNAYNNKRNKDSNNLVRMVNNRLRKNYRILQDMNPYGKTRASRTKLLEKGFDFEHITHIYTTKKGSIYYFVYDMGYLPIENDQYMLVKRSV